MLKEGHYVLSRDVENPRPDRRKARELRAKPVWSAGTRLYVRERGYTTIEFEDDRYHASSGISLGDEAQFEALSAAMVPSPEPEDYDGLFVRLWAKDCGSPILRQLFRDGKITLADIEAAYINLTNRKEEI